MSTEIPEEEGLRFSDKPNPRIEKRVWNKISDGLPKDEDGDIDYSPKLWKDGRFINRTVYGGHMPHNQTIRLEWNDGFVGIPISKFTHWCEVPELEREKE